MRPALTLLAALVLGAAPLSAGATTAPTLTLAQQAKKADVIVRATLGTAVSVQEAGVTWTVYPLTVTETIAGDPASLPQREGKPALYLLAGVDGLPELRAGQEAFWLLYSRRLDSPVVGFTQGFYPIENGRVTRPGAATPAASTAPQGAAGTATAASGTAGTGTTGTTTGTPGAATPGAAAPGTAAPGTATAPGAPSTGTGTGTPGSTAGTPATPAAPTGSAAGTATPPSTATPPATTATPPAAPAATPTPTDPDPIESDPAKFRDALRAARGTP